MKGQTFILYTAGYLILTLLVYTMLYRLAMVTTTRTAPLLFITFDERIETSLGMEILKKFMDLKPQIIFQGKEIKLVDAFSRFTLNVSTNRTSSENFSVDADTDVESLVTSTETVRSGPMKIDEKLIREIRQRLYPPPRKPYKFSNRENYKVSANPSAGQIQAVRDILENFGKRGFYIECGANDGEKLSNTLWIEKYLGWKGLLIEGDPSSFLKLKNKNRRAWIGEFCLSDRAEAKNASFYIQNKWNSHLGSGLIRSENYEALTPVQVQCYPFHAILRAMNRTTVDFFSLDVEGSELDILRTIKFDKVFIKVITVEHLTLREGKMALRNFMENNGYIFYRTVVTPEYSSGDSIFIHKNVRLSPEHIRLIGIEDSDVTRLPR